MRSPRRTSPAHRASRSPQSTPTWRSARGCTELEVFWREYAGELLPLLDTELEPFADAVATARELHDQGIPLAVASSSRRERLDRTLTRANLDTLFAVSVAGDEIARGKPEPDMFLEAARRLGATPQDCVVIEDSAPGVAAGLAAGMSPPWACCATAWPRTRSPERTASCVRSPLRRCFRQREPPAVGVPCALEATALVRRQRGEVDRGLGVGREHHERLTGRQARQRLARLEQRQRAAESTASSSILV
jgi:HAD superfamily hydrolase (TIGR01509 family)